MSKLRHTLQLLHGGALSTRQIGAALGISKSTVSEIASYARVAGVDWALAQSLSDEELSRRLLALDCGFSLGNAVRQGSNCIVLTIPFRDSCVTVALVVEGLAVRSLHVSEVRADPVIERGLFP